MRSLVILLFFCAATLYAQQCPQGYTLTGGVCVANGSGGGGSSGAGATLPWTDPATFGVSASNTAAQNQTAFAAMATAVNAGSTSPQIWLKDGTYNVLSTGGTALGTYNVPIIFHCTDPQGTTINHTGSGMLIQMGQSGLIYGSSVAIWQPQRFENCGVTGGASASDGIFIPNYNVSAIVRDNYFSNYGNASIYDVHSQGITQTELIGNVWIQTDGQVRNFAWADITGNAAYTMMRARDNNLVCAISPTDTDTTSTCGVGFRSDGYGEFQHNLVSGPNPIFRIAAGASSLTTSIANNVLEVFGGTGGVLYGTPGGTSLETVSNLSVKGNQVLMYANTQFVQPANNYVSLVNADVSHNIARTDRPPAQVMVQQNNYAGQTGNTMIGNAGWTGGLHTSGANIIWLGADTLVSDPTSAVGDIIYRSSTSLGSAGLSRLAAGSGYLHWNGSAFTYDTPAASSEVRPCEIHLSGSGTGGILQTGDDAVANAVCSNQYGSTATITAVSCWVDAGSTVTINPSITGGASLLAAPLACGAGYAGLTTGTLSITSETAGQAFGVGMGGVLSSSHSLHVIFVRHL